MCIRDRCKDFAQTEQFFLAHTKRIELASLAGQDVAVVVGFSNEAAWAALRANQLVLTNRFTDSALELMDGGGLTVEEVTPLMLRSISLYLQNDLPRAGVALEDAFSCVASAIKTNPARVCREGQLLAEELSCRGFDKDAKNLLTMIANAYDVELNAQTTGQNVPEGQASFDMEVNPLITERVRARGKMRVRSS